MNPFRLIKKLTFFIVPTVLLLVLIALICNSISTKTRMKAVKTAFSQVGQWHNQISTELPLYHSQVWEDTSKIKPLQLLRACAAEYPIEN